MTTRKPRPDAKPSAKPSDYEVDQLKRISAWRDAPPDQLTRFFDRALSPATQVAQKAIPADWLRSALNGVQHGSARLANRRALLRKAGVSTLDELHEADLEDCDQHAGQVGRRGAALAGGTGALFGVVGAAGMVADVPTLLVQAFRVIHRIGLCYGEDCADAELKHLPVAIFALASASSLDEKQAALQVLERDAEADSAAIREGLERAAERELAKEAAVYSISNLAQAITRRLGLAKAGGTLPLLGALVGGAVNAWFLNEVATAARTAFQLRWLRRRYGSGLPLATAYGETLALEHLPDEA
ncbi:EcsC family protein [Nevskia sp.]|uniref:EcsC family protein n=1 Tax=Nevskia sp. TaxID=1929292 RepID=UPI0025F1F4E1|nr:EcsC family protein [Nevskia sp.]